ncbi:MAG: hypothetical protein RBS39_01995 [Phycisphaerales bacterium]|nr:hypothetical protein [Phycisphaerales bacterium]
MNPRRLTTHDATAALLAILIGSSGPALAQDATPSSDTTSSSDAAPPQVSAIPPQVLLGARVENVRRKLPVAPVLVVVPDAGSYAAAIERWSVASRFPVLIDDASERAREDIARFVRAFRPEHVVLWTAPDDARGPFPKDRNARQDAITRAAARAWDVPNDEAPPETDDPGADFLAALSRVGLTPPGLVLADASHACWPAALALSAGRGQPIAWVDRPEQPAGRMSLEDAESLATAVRAAAASLPFPFAEQGDAIDAVTLCLNVPVRFNRPPDELALTDLVARGTSSDLLARWAWAGQVQGDEARAAYAAMCALFLQPERAWLFDGYPDSTPWNAYDMTLAGENLRGTQLDTLVFDGPSRQSLDAWRTIVARPVDAGLILINSKGMRDEFHLAPGRARPSDAPMLEVPAIMHIVHSWSANAPLDRSTVAGRFLERGVYAYVGSVHEPYLQAFVPSPLIATRLASGVPLAPAVRQEGGPVWKITVLGDPLVTIGPPAPRTDELPSLVGAIDVDERARAAVRAHEYASAIHDFALLGRDEDAARLFAALRKEQPEALTPDLAHAAAPSLFRAPGASANDDLLFSLMTIARTDPLSPMERDLLWLALPRLASPKPPSGLLDLVRTNVRPEQRDSDAMRLADLYERYESPRLAAGVLRTLTEQFPEDARLRRACDERIKKLGGP